MLQSSIIAQNFFIFFTFLTFVKNMVLFIPDPEPDPECIPVPLPVPQQKVPVPTVPVLNILVFFRKR